MMKELQGNSLLFGANAPFVEDLYEAYLEDAAAVSSEWRGYFDRLSLLPGAASRDVPHAPIVKAYAKLSKRTRKNTSLSQEEARQNNQKQYAISQLIRAYRTVGVHVANLDPLKRQTRPPLPEIIPATYDLTEEDRATMFHTGGFAAVPERASLSQILDALKETYCGQVGVEYMYIHTREERLWLQGQFEPTRGKAHFTPQEKIRLLEKLTAAETLERYLHTRYVGQKRFSLEGGESLIVALDELIRTAGGLSVDDIVIGMAHRGRLNVLVNTLGKTPAQLFDEFEGKKSQVLSSGDVKYHLGYSSTVSTPGGPCHLSLAFNPSHLEIVNPVVEGYVYSRQVRRALLTLANGKEKVLPVLIHGDAAVAGQGVNQEMLNFGQTRGFGTGGTVHIVVNNQIGFTTSDPRDLRSTLYCTDLFKMVEAPIFHVNGDDPEAVAFAMRLAINFRQTFQKDVVVDIVCFRKLGHNEQDEPMVTQPLMYRRVAAHPGTRKTYADRLIAEGVLPEDAPEAMIRQYRETLDRGELLHNPVIAGHANPLQIDWTPFLPKAYLGACDTALPMTELRALSQGLTRIPEGFVLHPRVQKIIEDRRQMGQGALPVDWGMAENLAYASLLVAGHAVRISGEDVGRGTFFHRHAALHDQNRENRDEGTYYPLENLKENQARFQCFDSVLSEEAVLAFEYGYASANPFGLTVWEAQFGDFANGAQVVIDQFIASGEAKWGRACGLVLLLPHGYEGQGPEHSSARIERYMQLCAEDNMEVCQPTTPAQVFHMLRRQALRQQRKPLIVFSPKSLLRHKAAISSLEELAQGSFQPVLGETDLMPEADITRVLLCSGKLYYELVAARRELALKNVAIVRLEQLYPFPKDALSLEMAKYPNAKEIVWCQDEPINQGMWYWLASRQQLEHFFAGERKLFLVAREASPSPAVGYAAKHTQQQQKLITDAFGVLPSAAR